jgi:repressor LexA
MGRGSQTAERDVTPRQLELLGFISEYSAQHGLSPTIREIGEHLGIRSTNGVNDHLDSLMHKGCIDRSEATARSIQLTPKARLLLGLPSLKGAAQIALHVLDEVVKAPLDQALAQRVVQALDELRKAGVRR